MVYKRGTLQADIDWCKNKMSGEYYVLLSQLVSQYRLNLSCQYILARALASIPSGENEVIFTAPKWSTEARLLNATHKLISLGILHYHGQYRGITYVRLPLKES